MIKIVLDTNVLMSGIFWSGPPSQILLAWQKELIEIITSKDIINEYTRVSEILSQKYKTLDVESIINLITINSTVISPVHLPQPVSSDRDDDKFIACALSANCKLIISGDKHLLNISGYAGIQVLKPATFVRNYLKDQL
jgi:putative PIN family toxin of toxin-antitoxin system